MRRITAAIVVLTALALPAGALADDVAPPAVAAPAPMSLVVGLGLADPALQAGVLRGRDVILARGFEVELARTLARRLGGRVERFVHVALPGRLLASGGADWQLAFAGIEAGGLRAGAKASIPYLTTDVVVVARRGLDRPRRLADLRTAVVCAVRGGDGAEAAAALHPRRAPLFAVSADRLLMAVRTGACDAALVPAAEAGGFVAGQRRVLGPVVGRIRHGKGLVAAVATGGGLSISDVDRELVRLRRDGMLGRLARTWLGLDPAAVPVLR
ncbi:MAG TPA: transporter substrate-binding domain-containing protein [Gaiella sp.]|nr:transporter substrate-binding domain-containing protein [Gaiella sp.]